MFRMILFLFDIIVGYVVGSICSAVIVCRLFELPDPRTAGSKNPGATNVLRIAGKKYAAMVLIGDMLKGLLPVLLAKMLGSGDTLISITCVAAVLGHVFPVFFDFKGGKGVATALGGMLGLHFMLGVMVIATWLLVAKFSRYASLASILAIILAPFYSLVTIGNLHAFLPLILIALLVLYKHHDNITRLLEGTEEKIQFRNQSSDNGIMGDLLDGEIKAEKKTDKKNKM